MITLIFGQLNCGKHNVANSLRTQIDDDVVTLSELRDMYLKDLLDEDLVNKMLVEYGEFYLTNDEHFLTAFCRIFTEADIFVVVPNFCKKTALRCCSQMSHVRCILVAPSAAAIAKHRRTNVKADEFAANYVIPAKHYFNEESIRRNTARLVKETIAIANAYNVVERFWCYVSPEYLF